MIQRPHRDCESEGTLKPILFGLGPNVGVVAVELDVNDVGIAAHRAVFDVLLVAAGGWIEWDHDLFATTVANVSGLARELVFGFVVHD